jgi:hypothetical protein
MLSALVVLSMFVMIKVDCELTYRVIPPYYQQDLRADDNTRNVLAHMQNVWPLASCIGVSVNL